MAVIGGWTTGDQPCTKTARWFSHRIYSTEAPWAFACGKVSRTIACLELLAVVFGVALLLPTIPTEVITKGKAQCSVGTGNQGNEGLVHKW